MEGEILNKMSLKIKDEKIHSLSLIKKDFENNKVENEDDYLMKTIGAFGLWQAVVFVTVTLTRVVAMWNMMSITFLTPANDYICFEFSDNVTTEVINSTCYDNCLKYKYSSVIGSSIIEDFELICQKTWMASFTQSILMMGILLGVTLFGWISDRFGRRTALFQSTLLNALLMISLPFSPNYVVFICIRFGIGVATGGSMLICVVQVMEIIGKQYREVAGACCLIADALAEVTLAGFAYFTCTWQSFTLSYGVVTCFIFVLVFFVPESPRWLVSHGKFDEAIKVITRAAYRNKLDTSHIETTITKVVEELELKKCDIVKASYLDLFKSKNTFLLTMTVFILWFTQGMCFYGIYQYVTIIGVDPYLTVVILGLIQLPFCPMGIILNRRFGRRITTIGITSIIAITMLVLIFIQKGHWPATMLGVLAFICCNICTSISYIYVTELYPTSLRNMSLAFSSSGAKIGGVIAPFVANSSPRWVPSLIFCVIPIIGILCCLTLPETKGRNLKDTM